MGRGESENPRGGAKKRVNPQIQKFDKICVFAIGRFVMPSGVFIKENIASSIFKRSTRYTRDQILAFPSFSSSEMNFVGIMKMGIKS